MLAFYFYWIILQIESDFLITNFILSQNRLDLTKLINKTETELLQIKKKINNINQKWNNNNVLNKS